MGRKKNSVGHHLKYYCYMLNVASEAKISPVGYQLQKALNILPNQTNNNSSARDTKWDAYFHYQVSSPNSDTLKDIEFYFPDSSYILSLPFWLLFDKHSNPTCFYYDFLLKMPATIKRHIFSKANPYELKQKLTSRDVDTIVRMGNVHALGCLLALSKMQDLALIEIDQRIKTQHIESLLKICCVPSLSD